MAAAARSLPLSSGAESDAAKVKSKSTGRQKRKARPTATAPQQPLPTAIDPPFPVDSKEIKGEPAIRPISDLIQMFRTREHKAAPRASVAASGITTLAIADDPVGRAESLLSALGPVHSGPDDAVETPTTSIPSLVRPPPQKRIQELVNLIGSRRFLPDSNRTTTGLSSSEQEDICRKVRLGQYALIRSTATHESDLLIAAGRGVHPRSNGRVVEFPVCKARDGCVAVVYGRQIRVDGGSGLEPPPRVPMMQYMTETELKSILAGSIPFIQPRHCVLCTRFLIEDLLLEARGGASGGAMPTHHILQSYHNSEGDTDGYISSYVNRPMPGQPYMGLVAGIAAFNVSVLRWTKAPDGRPMIDQSRMVWRPSDPLKPYVGETLRNF